jgi:uncharacterized protein YcbK (DUF882 family)
MPVLSPPAQFVRAYLPVYQYLVPRLNFLAERFPEARPTSWYRSRADNVRVGGAPQSQHRLGFAADFSPVRREDYQRLAGLARAVGLVAVVESDHVHVQTFLAGVLPARLFV